MKKYALKCFLTLAGLTVLAIGSLIVKAQPKGDMSKTKTPTSAADKVSQTRQWREDLRYLAERMPKVHKNLFHKMTREEFNEAVESLNRRIPLLNRNQIIVELARIVAMVGDGHTRMGLVPNRLRIDPKIGFRQYPLKLYLFKDGLFVYAAGEEYKNAVGARVVQIGDEPVDEAFKRVGEIAFRDNEMTVKDRVPYLLTVPEILGALGLISDMEKAPFTVEKDGEQITITLKPVAKAADIKMIDARDFAQKPAPLWLKDVRNNYWFEYLADSRTIYVQYNVVADKPDESFAAFCKRVFAFAEAHPVDKFIIDLRNNEGGNSNLNWPLIYGLIRSDKLNQPGKLFTIIGRRTFSAGVNCADFLERHTNTVFVGEPTGSSPNQYGDTGAVILPNSGIAVEVSTLFHQEAGARDTRPWLAPQAAVELTSEDYRTNNDPALKLILSHIQLKSVTETIRKAVQANDFKLAVKQYHDYKNDPLHTYAETETEINNFGYQLLGANQFRQAIEVFKLNVESYPRSANTYDSLAEAYMKYGDKPSAIRNYEKSLQLDPNNSNAVKLLKILKGK